jgi:hypothetical protein
MWQDVQIFTGGKCYTDDRGKVAIRNEKHPEKYLVGPTERDCNGGSIWKEFSNPERLLDMTFEGPLSLLLRHHEYEVDTGKVSEEVRRILLPETSEVADEVTDYVSTLLDGQIGWDPTEGNKKRRLREDIAKIVRNAEERSKTTCEWCGDTKTVSLRTDLGGRIVTLCDSCVGKFIERRKQRHKEIEEKRKEIFEKLKSNGEESD